MASTGEQLGRYHLVRKIATGGMAEIFLAKVVGPGGFEKSLVIKRILPNLAKNPEFVSMFLQEARLAAQFAHPAVVQIFDFGEVEGAYFLAMEFVDGPNLRAVLKSTPDRRLPLALGARIIAEACEGLAYVHDFTDPNGAHLGLMHCDVSTDNMLIARNGAVKVVDFGLATTSTQMANATPGTVKGKIAYMPPEQIIGEADLRADVYALGVILYELAAGTRPYEQMPDQQLLAAIIKTDPVPLRSRRPDVPRAYADIVSKAMAKNLAERFQNCHELASALEEFIAQSGERVGPRQIAALVTQLSEDSPRPISQGTPITATPFSRKTPTRISPPHGLPAASQKPALGKDPFAAFGALAARPPAPPPPPAPAGNDLFNQFFSDLVDEAAAPRPPPPAAPVSAPKAAPVSRGMQTVTLDGEGEALPRGQLTVKLDGTAAVPGHGGAKTVTLDGSADDDLDARIAAVLGERATALGIGVKKDTRASGAHKALTPASADQNRGATGRLGGLNAPGGVSSGSGVTAGRGGPASSGSGVAGASASSDQSRGTTSGRLNAPGSVSSGSEVTAAGRGAPASSDSGVAGSDQSRGGRQGGLNASGSRGAPVSSGSGVAGTSGIGSSASSGSGVASLRSGGVASLTSGVGSGIPGVAPVASSGAGGAFGGTSSVGGFVGGPDAGVAPVTAGGGGGIPGGGIAGTSGVAGFVAGSSGGIPGVAPVTSSVGAIPGVAPVTSGAGAFPGGGIAGTSGVGGASVGAIPGVAPVTSGTGAFPGVAPLTSGGGIAGPSGVGVVPGVAPLTSGVGGAFGAAPGVTPVTSGSGVVAAIPGLDASHGAFGSSGSGALFPAPASSPSGQRTQSAAELRAAVVLADAVAMRLFEPGVPLAPAPDLELIRREVERDEGLQLAVRFACHAPRLLKTMEAAEGLISERVAGAVEGLFVAEAWGPLATLLERLRASADVDTHHRWVFELASGLVANSDQARRIVAWLREGPPADAEGLGRLLPFFGPAFANLWLELFESLDLPASRDAVLPGLAALATLNPEPFLERLKPKRPRRLSELVYCLEKGRHPNRQRVVRELLGRLDPSRQREVLAGLARAGSDDAFRQLTQSLTDEAEETRVLALQLLAKHFPERAFEAVGGLLSHPATATRSEAERRALWVAVGSSTAPAAFDALVAELSQKPSLLNRAKVDARKVDALEGLAVMKAPAAGDLMRRLAEDGAQSESVRSAAMRHLRAWLLIVQTEQTTSTWVAGSRRWDRTPPSWRDVLLDLSSLAAASRVLELDGAAFDPVFERLTHRLATLLAGGQASVTTNGALQVNSQAIQDGADAALDRAYKALQARGVSGFTFVRPPPRTELEHLARWLAAGAAAEGIETPSITRQATQAAPAKAAPIFKVPLMADFSREAMVRYVELVLTFRGWLAERKANPRAEFPDVRQLLFELVAALTSREVRFLGLTPRARNRDAELFHAANVTTLAVAFGAELGLSSPRLLDLAAYAFFTDVGNLELKDETFDRAGKLTEEDQRDVAAAKRASARFPFAQHGDKRLATSWATAVTEQDVENASAVGLLGSVVALARAYETLSCATSTREAMTPQAALEVLTQKAAHRFRPELVPLFARFLQRQSLRPLAR